MDWIGLENFITVYTRANGTAQPVAQPTDRGPLAPGTNRALLYCIFSLMDLHMTHAEMCVKERYRYRYRYTCALAEKSGQCPIRPRPVGRWVRRDENVGGARGGERGLDWIGKFQNRLHPCERRDYLMKYYFSVALAVGAQMRRPPPCGVGNDLEASEVFKTSVH